MNQLRYPSWLLLCLCMVLMLNACGPGQPPQTSLSGRTMGTGYSVKIISDQDIDPEQLKADIDARLAGINSIMSTYDPESSLSRFNRYQGTDWFDVPYSLVEVVEAAQIISRQSSGAFDITVGPLVDLWGFGPQGPSTVEPESTALEEARSSVGFEKLIRRAEPAALKKTVPTLRADLSAIAKGYAVDQIAALLEAKGFDRYLVEIGGELRVQGLNSKGVPWRLGVEKPRSQGRQVQQLIQLSGGAIATSGDYRNFFEANGQRFSHTIDPDTGRPVAHTLASVTVVADSCMLADGWATALMALGPEKGMQVAERLSIAAFFIQRTEKGFLETSSTVFKQRFEKPESGT